MYGKDGTFSNNRGYVQKASLAFYDLPGQKQAQAHPFDLANIVLPVKTLEDLIEMVRLNTLPVISDCDLHKEIGF